MSAFLTFSLLVVVFYMFIQFARQEEIMDKFEDTINDTEGRLEWARTRSFFPFGMKSQLRVSSDLLMRAKSLWEQDKWYQAHSVALKSQEAMNRAQRIYTRAITHR